MIKYSNMISKVFTLIICIVLAFMFYVFNNQKVMEAINFAVSDSPIYIGNENKKQMALMINVYWGTEFIEPMLKIFKEKGIKVTFFVGGSWVDDNKELLQKMVAEGHEIGNHGYYHYKHSTLSHEQSIKNIQDAHNIVKDYTGIDMTLFAPPSGDFKKQTVSDAESLGYKTIMWTIDTIDWRDKDVDLIETRVLDKKRNGALVLMHPTAHTVAALPKIIDGLKESGFALTTVSQALE